MKIGFDNEKYLKMQSEHILERIKKFDNKLYLEFGGKLFDDYHASRVLPGFKPDTNIRTRTPISLNWHWVSTTRPTDGLSVPVSTCFPLLRVPRLSVVTEALSRWTNA